MLPVDSSPPAEGTDNQRKKTKMRLAFWPHYHSLLDTWGTPELRLPWGGGGGGGGGGAPSMSFSFKRTENMVVVLWRVNGVKGLCV